MHTKKARTYGSRTMRAVSEAVQPLNRQPVRTVLGASPANSPTGQVGNPPTAASNIMPNAIDVSISSWLLEMLVWLGWPSDVDPRMPVRVTVPPPSKIVHFMVVSASPRHRRKRVVVERRQHIVLRPSGPPRPGRQVSVCKPLVAIDGQVDVWSFPTHYVFPSAPGAAALSVFGPDKEIVGPEAREVSMPLMPTMMGKVADGSRLPGASHRHIIHRIRLSYDAEEKCSGINRNENTA